MLFEWTKEKIDYFISASEFTGFHEKLAGEIIPYLSREDDLIDIGCGLGLIDFEIANEVNSITAVDENELVIATISEEVIRRNVNNIHPKISDFKDIKENKWDIMLLSFFGEPDKYLRELMTTSKKRTILITHGEDYQQTNSKLLPLAKTIYATQLEDYFKSNDFNYLRKNIVMDFGQPFKSEEDATNFLESYALQTDPKERKRRIEEMLSKVEKTGDSQFPLFLPKERQISILVLER